MNINPLSWLRGRLVRLEAAEWASKGLILPEQQQQITKLYDEDCCGLSGSQCARLALIGLSAAAIIAALVLVATDHWRHIHVAVKLAIALPAMLAAHAAAYHAMFRQDQPGRAIPFFFAGTALYGCILLIIFDAHHAGTTLWPVSLSWSLLLWSAGALALAWVLNSTSLLVLSALVGASWVVAHVLVTEQASATSVFVVECLCLFRWSYTNRSRTVFIVTLGTLAVWWCMLAVAEGLDRSAVYWIAAAGPLLMLLALRHDPAHPFAPLLSIAGSLWCALVILPLSWPGVSAALLSRGFRENSWLAASLAIALVILYVPAPRRINYRTDWAPFALLTAVTGLPAALNIVCHGTDFNGVAVWLLVAVFNGAAIATGVWLILQGAELDQPLQILVGVLYLVLWGTLLALDLAGNWTQAAVILAVASAAIFLSVRFFARRQTAGHDTIPVTHV